MSEWTEYYLKAFKRLRYDWKDDIPERELHSPDGNYKVRGGWFHAISLRSETAIELGLLDKSCVKKRSQFIDYIRANDVGRSTRRTIREDIRAGDDALDTFIACLEKQEGAKK